MKLSGRLLTAPAGTFPGTLFLRKNNSLDAALLSPYAAPLYGLFTVARNCIRESASCCSRRTDSSSRSSKEYPEQNLEGRRIAIVVLGNPQRPAVHRHIDRAIEAVNAAKPDSFVEVETPWE